MLCATEWWEWAHSTAPGTLETEGWVMRVLISD